MRCKRGAYSVEFAMVASVLMLLIMAAFEMAWHGLTSVAVENALLQATRAASLGCQQADGSRSGRPGLNQILAAARKAGGGLLGGNTLALTPTAYGNLANANATPQTGGAAGTGLGGQIVEYKLTYSPPLAFAAKLVGRSAYAHSGTITIKNEPFPDGGAGAQACS